MAEAFLLGLGHIVTRTGEAFKATLVKRKVALEKVLAQKERLIAAKDKSQKAAKQKAGTCVKKEEPEAFRVDIRQRSVQRR